MRAEILVQDQVPVRLRHEVSRVIRREQLLPLGPAAP